MPPTSGQTAPLTTATPCDTSRCPASALVMVSKALPNTSPVPAATPTGYLAFCGHHYRDHEVLLAAHGWSIVADLRTWKADR